MKLAAAILALLAGICFAHESPDRLSLPKDVTGWGKIKWGMTLADVRAAYGIAEEPETGGDKRVWDNLELDPVKVGDISLNAYAQAKHGDGEPISKIKLWMSFGLKNSAPSASAKDFDTLRTLLTQKYGSPASEEAKRDGDDRVRTLLWTFPSTSILLTLKDGDFGLGFIELVYTATDKKELDKL